MSESLPADGDERRVAGMVGGVDVGAVGEQRLHDAGVTRAIVALASEHQRREIAGKARVQVGGTFLREEEE